MVSVEGAGLLIIGCDRPIIANNAFADAVYHSIIIATEAQMTKRSIL